MKIVAFSTPNDPALGYWLRELFESGYGKNLTIVLDLKGLTPRDLEIWEERTAGRLPEIPVEKFLGTRIYYVENHNDNVCAELLHDLKPDLLLNCGTPRIVKRHILDIPSVGMLCTHPGKLPEYRGCSCVEWALYNGDAVCNTAFLMQEGIDDGPIVEIEEVFIGSTDGYVDIRVKTYEAGFRLMARAVKKIETQGETFAPKMPKSPGNYWKPIDSERMELLLTRLDGKIRS